MLNVNEFIDEAVTDQIKTSPEMLKAANKFISSISIKGIKCTLDNGFGNIIFQKENRTMPISHHCFYRHSGIAVIYKDVDNNSTQEVQVTPEIFYNTFMKHYIEEYFNINL